MQFRLYDVKQIKLWIKRRAAGASASASSRAPKPDGRRPQNSQYRFGLGFISGHRRMVVLIKCKYVLTGSRKCINSTDRSVERSFLSRRRDWAINAIAVNKKGWELIKMWCDAYGDNLLINDKVCLLTAVHFIKGTPYERINIFSLSSLFNITNIKTL